MNDSTPKGWIDGGRVFPERPAGYGRAVHRPPDRSSTKVAGPVRPELEGFSR
ncbi:MAG TPA: hypothetical protein VI756_05390 [Blastocatellia bacterium]